MNHKNKTAHFLMFILLRIWTLDAIAVSKAVESMNQIYVLGFKTIFSVPVITLFAMYTKQIRLPEKNDIGILIYATILGDILYFYLEYTAYKYLPVGTVTVVLGMMPAVSYITGCVSEKRKPRLSIVLLIIMSIMGLSMVVLNEIGNGKIIGYISCVFAIIIWILYGKVLKKLNDTYSSVSISFIEAIIASVMMFPFAYSARPAHISIVEFVFLIAVMGALNSGFGYMIEVNGLIELGTTISGIYLNFLPVFTSVAGYIILHQKMSTIQIIGSAIVILCSLTIIIKNQDEI